jgi:hypothetical protein
MSGERQSVAASSQPICRCSKIDLERKRKIIKKCESGQSLLAVAPARLIFPFIFVQIEKHG